MSLASGVSLLTLVAMLGSALVSGVLYAFSSLVMDGLGRVEPQHGMRAMQGINEAAYAPAFMGLFLGTAGVAIVLVLCTLASGNAVVGKGWIGLGAALYVCGVIAVTAIGNVPMNHSLAAKSVADPGGLAYRVTYRLNWTLVNHVRAVASMAAAGAFLRAFVMR